MMCWNYDKTPWEEFPDMSISLLSASSSSKEFTLKIPPQVLHKIFTCKLVVGSYFHPLFFLCFCYYHVGNFMVIKGLVVERPK